MIRVFINFDKTSTNVYGSRVAWIWYKTLSDTKLLCELFYFSLTFSLAAQRFFCRMSFKVTTIEPSLYKQNIYVHFFFLFLYICLSDCTSSVYVSLFFTCLWIIFLCFFVVFCQVQKYLLLSDIEY